MPFDPISWMASFSLGRVAGRILQPSRDRQLTKKLRHAVEDWAENNDPPVRALLDTIFSLEIDESQPEQFAARRQMSETMLSKLVPSQQQIADALLERWDDCRTGHAEQDLEPFFQLSRDDAAKQLGTLAARIRTVLIEDESLFKNTVIERLETLTAKVEVGRPNTDDASPVFTVPYPRHTCFKGREDILSSLRESLVGDKKAALTQVIRGLGGIGKTQTAVEYAYEHRDRYKTVLWIKAATDLEIRQDMADAAKLLKLPHDQTNLEEAVRALKFWLARNSDWLLIFDNADHPERLKPFIPPTSEGHILLTSRASVFTALGILDPIELPLLSVEDAVQFLLERTQRDAGDDADVDSARELAKRLGLLPLALEQAGAYIHELRLSFAGYLDRYRKRHLEFLEHGQPMMGDYPESVATTWLINFEEVESESEASADLFRLTAFLSPDNIPFELILLGVSATNSSLAKALSESDDSELTLRETLRPLARFSLVTISGKNESYGTHRLVQEAVQHSIGDTGCRTWAKRTVDMVNEAFPSIEFENWDLCARLVSHAVVATTQAEALDIQSPEVACLENEAALFLHERAQYTEAESLYKQAMEQLRVAVGEQHTDFAVCLNNLATLYQAMGRPEEAEPLYEQSVDIWRVAVGEQHPDFATGVNNLAELHRSVARYTEAEPLYQQAIEIRRITLGEQHPLYAASVNNLALLYQATGQHAKAEPLLKQSIGIVRSTLGEKHPHFASGINNLAALYHETGRHADAEPLYKQSMEITRVALGERHPDFATNLNNLAALYRAMGRHAEAELLYKQSMEIRRITLGEQHPDFAASRRNLATLYREMGRHDEAAELENKADS